MCTWKILSPISYTPLPSISSFICCKEACVGVKGEPTGAKRDVKMYGPDCEEEWAPYTIYTCKNLIKRIFNFEKLEFSFCFLRHALSNVWVTFRTYTNESCISHKQKQFSFSPWLKDIWGRVCHKHLTEMLIIGIQRRWPTLPWL